MSSDGTPGEFVEDDRPNPQSVYAQSKRRSEKLPLQRVSNCYVIRTAVLFGPRGRSAVSKKSVVDVMLDLSTKTNTIHAVADEISNVTYAPDLAVTTKAPIESRAPAGIYHLTNSGRASWVEFAAEVFRLTDRHIELVPVSSSAFPRKANRPGKALLLNKKTALLRSWQAALSQHLEERGIIHYRVGQGFSTCPESNAG
jgi:dTDP-4-dehydrorhamnose reductase